MPCEDLFVLTTADLVSSQGARHHGPCRRWETLFPSVPVPLPLSLQRSGEPTSRERVTYGPVPGMSFDSVFPSPDPPFPPSG